MARHLIVYFARKKTQFSLATIGLYVGGRDHATALHSIRKVEEWMAEKSEIRALVKIIGDELNLIIRTQ